jgi:hypothetical protein
VKALTVAECLGNLEEYYGVWGNTRVLEDVTEQLSKYSDDAITEIYQEIIRGRAARCGAPDVSSVEIAIKKLSDRHELILRSGEKESRVKCPVCSSTVHWATCGHCGYEVGFDIQEHKAWFRDYQAGRTPRLNEGDLLKGLLQRISVRRFANEKQANGQG